jgi:glycosyltransferase involved in cell wall biosynthesis
VTVHILFLTDNFPPEVNAPASRTFEHCREWVKQGHQVTVITGAPNFPAGKLYAGYKNRLFSRENMDGIKVVRVWTYIAANEGFLKRTLDYVSFAVTGTLASLRVRRVDVIVGTSPQFFTVCAARVIAFLKRRPWVFELRDLWPESIRAVGALKDGPVLRALERLEQHLYRKADAVVSVTHAFRDTLIGRGIDPGKIHVVTNGADLSRFSPRPKDQALSSRLGLSGKFVVGYVGTLGMAHALETVLEAAKRLEHEGQGDRIAFLFLGNGAQKQALVERAESLALKSVTFVDSVPKSEVAHYWSLVNLAVIHLKRDPLFTTVVPSKLFECMAMGIPVAHGVRGESAGLVERDQVGVCFEPENPNELAALVLRLADDRGSMEEMSARGVDAARAYDRSRLALRMLEVIEGLSSRKARPGRAAERLTKRRAYR